MTREVTDTPLMDLQFDRDEVAHDLLRRPFAIRGGLLGRGASRSRDDIGKSSESLESLVALCHHAARVSSID